MIINQHPLIFSCDTCDDTLDTGTSDFRRALGVVRSYGWKSVPPQYNHPNPGHWGHRCAFCRATTREKSQREVPSDSSDRLKPRLIMSRRLYRRIQSYLHPDREPDLELKKQMEEVFKAFTNIPVDYSEE